MKKPIICTPVVGKTLREFLHNLKLTQKFSNFIELRTDYIRNLKTSDLQIICDNTFKKSIFTCRNKNEGGFFRGNEKLRIEILKYASKLDFDFIDIELSTLLNFKINIKKSKLLISYHNFKSTPKSVMLVELLNKMNSYNPSIIKISTYVNSKNDILNLLNFALIKKFKSKKIIIGMGIKGRTVRLIAPYFGSYLTYSSAISSNTAPGQFDFAFLNSLYKLN